MEGNVAMVNYFHLFQQKQIAKLVQTVLHGKLTVIGTSDQLRNKNFRQSFDLHDVISNILVNGLRSGSERGLLWSKQ